MSAAVNSDPKILRGERFETVLISWAVVMG
jgi:hypothetical protein